MNVRFTAWFSEAEREAIDRAAEELSTSANFIVRSAVRQALGLPHTPLRLLHVTTETPDTVETAAK